MSRPIQPREAREHHYVPQFLLKAWAVDNLGLDLIAGHARNQLGRAAILPR